MNLILKKQQELQDTLAGGMTPMSSGSLCSDVRDMAFFLNQEVIELIEEIGGSRDINKPWKEGFNDLYSAEINITDKVRSEAIDVLKFCLNICLLAGITPENIKEEFDKVHKRNLQRIEDGY